MIKKIVITFILLVGLIYSQQQVDIPWPTLAKSDWPMIKHDPQFTGRSPYIGPQTPTIVWTKDMEYGIFSGPVIGEAGNLYFGSYHVFADYFYSYSPNGNLVWDYQTGSERATQSGILIDSSNTIYFGSRDSCLYALNLDGTLKWKYNTSGSILSNVIPNIDLEGNIYITNFVSVMTDEGELVSVIPNGTLNWKVTYESGFAGKSPVFSPDGSTIYIAGLDSNLFALNLDGSIKWKFSCGPIMTAPMVDSDGRIYAVASNYLYSISDAGNLIWNYFLFGTPIAIPTIDKKGNIYTIAWDTTCCPYYPKLVSLTYNGELRWEYIFDDVEADHFEQPLICDSEGTVYVGSTVGSYYYAISSEGDLKWQIQLNDLKQQVDNTGAISKDGTLYLGVHNSSLATGQEKTLIAIRDTGSTGVKDYINIVDYKLMQNYPNPFNQATTIAYSIPNDGLVTLRVFDILGSQVATLVNEFQSAGSYNIILNASNLTSGIYFYTLTSGNFRDTKKLILLK